VSTVNSGPPKALRTTSGSRSLSRGDSGHAATQRPRRGAFGRASRCPPRRRDQQLRLVAPRACGGERSGDGGVAHPDPAEGDTASPAASKPSRRPRGEQVSTPWLTPTPTRRPSLGASCPGTGGTRRCLQHARGPSETGGPWSRPPSNSLYGPAQSAALTGSLPLHYTSMRCTGHGVVVMPPPAIASLTGANVSEV
jgi:hypothetical protein